MSAEVTKIPTRAQRVVDFFRDLARRAETTRCVSVVLEKQDGALETFAFDCDARDLALHALFLQSTAEDTVLTTREKT